MRHHATARLKSRTIPADTGSAMMNARRFAFLVTLATVAGFALSLAVAFA
jgi:hypothetical protein